MFVIIGIFVVLACVIGGYILEHGNMAMLFQPVELLIIGGAALGGLLISAPKKILFGVLRDLLAIFKGKNVSKGDYIEILLMLFDLLSLARREGVIAIETHVNAPDKSSFFDKRPSVRANHHVRDFICDNLKAFMAANMEAHEFESLMDTDIDAHHTDAMVSSAMVNKTADSLPGLGIVAAVLGVILTMAKISEPPEVLGHSIGAALVGTFLGVLLCYGFVGPMATNMEHTVREQSAQLQVVKAALVAFAMGWPPVMALESARRAIPSRDRPSFDELEEVIKGAKMSAKG